MSEFEKVLMWRKANKAQIGEQAHKSEWGCFQLEEFGIRHIQSKIKSIELIANFQKAGGRRNVAHKGKGEGSENSKMMYSRATPALV